MHLDPTLTTATASRTWSPFQQAIFTDVATAQGHTVVLARAGSGKTSTIVEAFRYIPPGLTTLMVAFNKSIATELQARAPRSVTVQTLHAYGFAAIRAAVRSTRVDQDKVPAFLHARHGRDKDTSEFRGAVARLTSLAKSSLAYDAPDLDALIDAFELDVGEHRAKVLEETRAALDYSAQHTDVIDFDDMVWLPVYLNMRCRQFDRVFIDETQDLNPVQIELALRACAPQGRILAVGDDRQAIYGFRGADANAIPNIVRRLEAHVLPLSVTYRCARAIVAHVNPIVPDLEPAPNAEDGFVTPVSYEAMKAAARPGDFILSRVNAPLVGLCLGFLKEGRRANIQGRDVGASLHALVKKSKARTVEALTTFVVRWRDKECARLASLDRDAQSVVDRAECILALTEGAETVQEVTDKINALFTDDRGGDSTKIVLSSTHKAKGLERDRVFMLAYTYQKREGVEEDNLAYVAATRARKELYLADKPLGAE